MGTMSRSVEPPKRPTRRRDSPLKIRPNSFATIFASTPSVETPKGQPVVVSFPSRRSAATLRCQTTHKFPRRKDATANTPPPPVRAISGADVVELYKLFCSIVGKDNKADVVHFTQLCDHNNLTAQMGRRLSSALQAVLMHVKVDWATFAWYLDAPIGSVHNRNSQLDVTTDTDLYEAFRQCFPVMRSTSDVSRARQMLRKMGGLRAIRAWLQKRSLLHGTYLDTRGDSATNFFAQLSAGVSEQRDMARENALLGHWKHKFIAVRNLPEHDMEWNNPEQEGYSSMGPHHRLLCLKDLHFKWFNALTFGLEDADIDEALTLVENLELAADSYRRAMGWGPVGLFVHLFGHNSVDAFHLHVVDLLRVGPSFHAFRYKNCQLKVIEGVLRIERAKLSKRTSPRESSLDGGQNQHEMQGLPFAQYGVPDDETSPVSEPHSRNLGLDAVQTFQADASLETVYVDAHGVYESGEGGYPSGSSGATLLESANFAVTLDPRNVESPRASAEDHGPAHESGAATFCESAKTVWNGADSLDAINPDDPLDLCENSKAPAPLDSANTGAEVDSRYVTVPVLSGDSNGAGDAIFSELVTSSGSLRNSLTRTPNVRVREVVARELQKPIEVYPCPAHHSSAHPNGVRSHVGQARCRGLSAASAKSTDILCISPPPTPSNPQVKPETLKIADPHYILQSTPKRRATDTLLGNTNPRKEALAGAGRASASSEPLKGRPQLRGILKY